MNSGIELIMTRHSIRQYTGQAIPDSVWETLVRAAMAAPSAVNVQPWEFLIVTERAIIQTLFESLPYAKMLDKAAGAIIVCGVPNKDAEVSRFYWEVDCAAATQNILLAAHALGYGAVWTALNPQHDRMEIVRQACKVPPSIQPFSLIPVGVPLSPVSKPLDKYHREYIHFDRW